MPLNTHVLGLLSEREYQRRLLVLEQGRIGAERLAAQAQVRFWRQMATDATAAVLRHQLAGNPDPNWAARCRHTLVVARRQYLEAQRRLAEIDGRQRAVK